MPQRSPRAVRRLDGSKFAVFLVLSVLAIVLFVTHSRQQQLQTLPPVVQLTPIATFTAEAVVAAPVLVSPMTGETFTAGTVQLSGEAQPGYTVQARLNGRLLGSTVADAQGAWTLPARVPAAGDHLLALEVLDDLGRVVAAAEPISVTVAALAVRAPSLDPALMGASLTTGPLLLEGEGEPGATVQVVAGGKPLGQALVGADGRWQFAAEINSPGVYAFALTSTDANGRVLATATPVRLVFDRPAQAIAAAPATATTVPTPVPTPVPTAVPTAEPTTKPLPTATATQKPPATETATETATASATPLTAATATTAVVVERMVLAGTDEERSVTVSGSGMPGSEVQVVIGDTTVATATVDAGGGWVISASLPLTQAASVGVRWAGLDGVTTPQPVPLDRIMIEAPSATPQPTETATETFTPRPTQTPVPTDTSTATTTPSPAATETFTATPTPQPVTPPTATPTPEPDAPTVGSVRVGGGGDAGAVAVSGTGEAGRTVQLLLGGSPVATTTVTAQGSWQFSTTVEAGGPYTVSVALLNADGEPGAVSAPLAIEVLPPVATATATQEPTATNTATASATPVPTNTATEEPTATATEEPTATATEEPTATNTATASTTPVPTNTATEEPTATATEEPTATNTATASTTPIPTSTATEKPTATDTNGSTATDLPVIGVATALISSATDEQVTTPVLPDTATASATSVPTSTATEEPTATVTDEPTATNTATASTTPVPTSTAPEEPTATRTDEPTVTNTATASATPVLAGAATDEQVTTPVRPDTAENTAENQPTATATDKPTATMTATESISSVPTSTATVEPTPSATQEPTDTFTATTSATSTSTATEESTAATMATAGEPTANATAVPTDTATEEQEQGEGGEQPADSQQPGAAISAAGTDEPPIGAAGLPPTGVSLAGAGRPLVAVLISALGLLLLAAGDRARHRTRRRSERAVRR